MKSFAEIFRSHCIFDANGRHTGGTDRESNHHYGAAYQSLFPDPLAVKLLMEVGNADGAGLLAFRECFQAAHCVGLDIERCACQPGPRLEFHQGDQRSQEACCRAANGRWFDLIVEDAMHTTENTLLTLFWMWPFVKPGGMYIVEEWSNVCSQKANIIALWPFAEIVSTPGPFGGDEPLCVFRKPMPVDRNDERDE